MGTTFILQIAQHILGFMAGKLHRSKWVEVSLIIVVIGLLLAIWGTGYLEREYDGVPVPVEVLPEDSTWTVIIATWDNEKFYAMAKNNKTGKMANIVAKEEIPSRFAIEKSGWFFGKWRKGKVVRLDESQSKQTRRKK